MEGTILIVGASARAAASSARRAGLSPMAIDLFADRDLDASPSARLPGKAYPGGILALARGFPPAPFLYTGAMENHPRLVEKLARERTLWGNPPAAIERARDPFLVRAALVEAGLDCPRAHPGSAPPPRGARWLRKPLRGGGGRGIAQAGSPPERDWGPHYFQEWIRGTPMSAVYVAGDQTTLLLGLTVQLVGVRALGGPPFGYAGSTGPILPGRRLAARLARAGEALRAALGLRGLFGVDLVLRRGEPWPVEVNPRYTAAVEVIEEARGLSAIELHAAAFLSRPFPPLPGPSNAKPGCLGKAIVFARRGVAVPEGLEEGVRAADLPRPGERIAAGRPVLTVFARGATVEACRRKLLSAAARVRRRLEAASRSPRRSSSPPRTPRSPPPAAPSPARWESPGP